MVPLPRTVRPLIQFALALAVIALAVLWPEWRVELQVAGSYNLTINSGNNQTAPVLEALPQPLVVQVTDQSGNPPTTNVPITFSVTHEPTGVQHRAVLSNPNAIVRSGSTTASTDLILGDMPGVYEVTASCTVCTPPSVTFTETAQGLAISSSLNRVWANGHEKTEITITVLNTQGQGVAGRRIHLSANPADGVSISPPGGNATTDTSGKALFVATSTKIGPVVFTATDVGNPALVASAQVEFIQRRVVVFVQGINTELNSDIDQDIFPAIRNLLFVLGFKRPSIGPPETGKQCADIKDDDGDSAPNDGCPLILNYSYDDGGVSKDGLWAPFSYICNDTSHSLELSITRLGNLLRKFGTANPNTRFIIIGHSQGGLIALQSLRFVGLPGIKIDTVITLDGALGGAPDADTFLTDVFTCWGFPAAQQMSILWNSASDHNRQGTTARFMGQTNEDLVTEAQAKNVKVVTIGSFDDCVWNPQRCGLFERNNESTQIIENATVRALLPLGANCPLGLCLTLSHSIVQTDPNVLNIIQLAVDSPTVP